MVGLVKFKLTKQKGIGYSFRRNHDFIFIFPQICVTTVFMVALTRGIVYSFGEFLKDIENEFCDGNCEATLGWIVSVSIGKQSGWVYCLWNDTSL